MSSEKDGICGKLMGVLAEIIEDCLADEGILQQTQINIVESITQTLKQNFIHKISLHIQKLKSQLKNNEQSHQNQKEKIAHQLKTLQKQYSDVSVCLLEHTSRENRVQEFLKREQFPNSDILQYCEQLKKIESQNNFVLGELKKQNRLLIAQVNYQQQKNKKLATEIEQFSLQQQQLQTLIMAHENKIREGASSIRELVHLNQHLLTSNGYLQREIISQKQAIESYKKMILKNESDLNENKEVIEKLEREVGQKIEQLREKDKRIERLQQYKKQLQTLNKNSQIRMKDFQKLRQNFQSESIQKQKIMDNIITESQLWKQKFQELQQTYQHQIQSQSSIHLQKQSFLTHQLNKLKEQLLNTQHSSSSTKKANHILKNQIQQNQMIFHRQVDEISRQIIKQYERKLVLEEERRNQVENELSEEKTRNQQLVQQIQKMNLIKESKNEKERQKMLKLERKIEKYEERMREIKRYCKEFKRFHKQIGYIKQNLGILKLVLCKNIQNICKLTKKQIIQLHKKAIMYQVDLQYQKQNKLTNQLFYPLQKNPEIDSCSSIHKPQTPKSSKLIQQKAELLSYYNSQFLKKQSS